MERHGFEVKKIRIAVVIASMVVEYAQQTLMGLTDEAKKCNADVYIFNAQASPDETVKHNVGEYNIYKLIDYSAFDGVILFANLIQGNSVFNEVIEKLRQAQVPTVSVDTAIEGFYHVGIRNYEAMRTIVEHFVEHHGFTRINYISGMDFNTDSQERFAAYRDVLTEHGLPVEEKRIFKGPFTQFSGEAAVVEMLRRREQEGEALPQAVICATDSIAIGVRSMFLKHGIRIPEDVAISGFDNTFEARSAIPSMTTVDRDQHNIGVQACKKIVARIRGEETLMQELFPAIPIIAGSCGCDMSDHTDTTAIRSRYLDLVQHYERYLYECNAMIEDLNETKNLEEFLEHLHRYVGAVESKGFFLCLDKELLEDLKFISDQPHGEVFHDNYVADGFPQRMAVVMAYEGGAYVPYDDFDVKQMWPWQEELRKEEGGNVYVFSPIHFRDRCMGYTIVENCYFATSSPLFSAWLINIADALESLRKQAHLKSMLERLDHMYVIDPLTKLYNRFGFARYTGDRFRESAEQGKELMILFADLDGLKKINDHYGHDKGDIAIKGAADALRNACVGDEVCARFGGDEYVVYAQGYTESDARAFCARLEEQIRRINEKLQEPFSVEISYGYEIVHPGKRDHIDRFIDEADNLMYNNKKRKKSEFSHKSEKIQKN
ncbi:MAG: GGDEF domain-containing protein [Lachnospiraceae bacterium]|nr:GGDEF domain-containing protein [Lachnospiraceae bacterium]